MMNKINVLIFPASGENAINIKEALKYNIHFNIFGATNKSDHAEFIYDSNSLVIDRLNIAEDDFIEKFNCLIEEKNIKFIIPTHDEISVYLMRHENEIKATICCSPLETAEIAYDKKKTYDLMSDEFFCPTIYNEVEEFIFPVFAKPIHGAGAKGVHMIKNIEEYNSLNLNKENYVFSEFLPGDEYTIDCFTDRNGQLKFAQARTRERIVNGITNRSIKVKDNTDFYKIANTINNKLKFRGAWFCQVKRDNNQKLKLLEIAVRQAGTMTYFREYGVNFPALTLFDFMNLNVEIIKNNLEVMNIFLDRCLHNSYKIDYDYENVYIDLDDTLIVNDKVNTKAMLYMYQCLNNNISVVLITKHNKDVISTLERFKIDKNIFSKIIHLKDNENKSDVIDNYKSIFIDNYYKERKEVSEKLGIPVFDVDAIECLILEDKI